MGWFSPWTVIIDGVNKTSLLGPICTNISVQDKEGVASDTASITMDDSYGRGILPRDKSEVKILIYGSLVFEGVVDKVRSKGNRSSGRSIHVSAKSFDVKGKAKDGQRWHKDDATLEEALKKSAEKAGFEIKVDEDLGKIKRDYWNPNGASFIAFAQGLAKELNATFKVRGKKSVFAARNKDLLPPLTAEYGKNLHDWDISPITARAKHKTAKARYFDRKKATWETVEKDIGSERAESTNMIRSSIADKDQAEQNLEARKGEAERGGGEGTITIELNPLAQPETPIVLIGTRPGVDGNYKAVDVAHQGTRSGSSTKIQIKHPSGDAGKDSRRK